MLKTISYSHSQIELRNLLFGTMIACAFAACSNEDDPIPNVDPTPTPETGTADLTIVVKNLTKSTQTKAGEDENAKEGEATIHNLFVALYNENGTFLQVSDLTANKDGETTDSNNEIKFEGLKAGASYRALAFANVPKDALSATANSFELTSDYYVLSGAGANGLPMSSGISPVFTLVEGENYYGYSSAAGGNSIEPGKPLGLIRNVARVELRALSLDMTQVKVNSSQKYKSGTIKFVPKDVFVLHGRKKANVADQDMSNTAWFNLPDKVWGNIAATYETADGDDYYSGTNSSNSFGCFAGTVDATNYIKVLSTAETTYTQSWDGTTITGDREITLANSLYFYVLPNNQTKAAREQDGQEEDGQASVLDKTTLASELVISGEVYIKAIMNDNTSWTFGEESTPVLRYWPIKIGTDGLGSEDTYYGQVHRNVVYNISATIAGNGYADPTLPKGDPTADLFVKTMVMNWGTATQAPVIE